jgi:WD40 repeat protein
MEHGEIRICKINPEDDVDFSNYWILSMHENNNGLISSICFSYDYKMLLTCGYDGNIYSFFINDDSPVPEIKIPVAKPATEFVRFSQIIYFV